MEGEENHELKIARLESNLERAAMYGKQLLDQVTAKAIECDELMDRITKCEVQQEILSQRLFLAQRDGNLACAREQNALKEIESLQEYCTKYESLQEQNRVLEEKVRLLEADKERRMQTITDLEEHLQEIRTQLSLAQAELEEFRFLEKRRTSPPKKTTKPGKHDESDEDALVSLVQTLQAELESVREILRQSVEEKEIALKKNFQNENKLQETIEEMNSIEREIAFYVNSVNEKNRKISELKEEIETLKAAQTDPNRRGNSIFAEVEDRRIEVEGKLLEAHTRLKFADESQRRLRSQLANCYTSLQIMGTHASKADQKYIKTLELEVMRLRAELCIIVTRVANPSGGEPYTERDLQDNPLAGLLLSERRQNAAFRKKIEDLVLHEGKRSEEMLRLGSELRASQTELEKSEKQRSVLTLKLNEKQIAERSSEGASTSAAVRPKVFKEVLTEIKEETERERQNEEKLLAHGKAGGAVRKGHGAAVSTSAQPQTSRTPREERRSEGEPMPQGTQQKESDSKAVKFNVGEEAVKPKQEQQLRGRQVKVIKSTKVENPECKNH